MLLIDKHSGLFVTLLALLPDSLWMKFVGENESVPLVLAVAKSWGEGYETLLVLQNK